MSGNGHDIDPFDGWCGTCRDWSNRNPLIRFYDRDGTRLRFFNYAARKNDREYSIIGFDKIGDAEVSTVWLGWDESSGRSEQPVIYETMIFTSDDSTVAQRYTTLEAARAGHAEHCQRLRETAGT